MRTNVYVTLVYELDAEDDASMNVCLSDLKSQTEFFPYEANRSRYKWRIKSVDDVHMSKPIVVPDIKSQDEYDVAMGLINELWNQGGQFADKILGVIGLAVEKYERDTIKDV
jgi:hypothetical protein